MSENYINDGDIDISSIFEALLRRRKIIYLATSVALTTSILYTSFQRIVNPVYSGNFVFLVNNPLETGSKKESMTKGAESLGYFSSFLKDSTRQDIPTLIDLLNSPAFLTPFAQNNNLNASNLSKKLTLKSQYDGRRQSEKGSIKVEYQANNPEKVLNTLIKLKDFYLEASLSERKRQLINGIKYLEEQEPILEEKSLILQNQLTNFRVNNRVGNPTLESQNLKQRLDRLDVNILNAENRSNRLAEIKREINLGKLSVGGFNEVIDSGIVREGMKSQGGISVKNVEDGFLMKTLELESELANAKTIFLPTSRKVKSLEKKLELLKPEINKQQLASLDLSISLNKSKLESLNAEKKVLTKEFLRLANLIEPFDFIAENLNVARLSQIDLNSTKNEFSLEIAQKNVTWRILQNPIAKSTPIEPSFLKNILIALIGGGFFGVVLALYKDLQDNVFHSTKELEENNLTILGQIPYTEIFSKALNRLNNLGNKVLGLVSNECSKPKHKDQKLSYQNQGAFNIYGKSPSDDVKKNDQYSKESSKTSLVSKYLKKFNEWLDN